VSIAFPVNAAEAPWVKQADHWPRGCLGIDITGFLERSKLAKHASEVDHAANWDEARGLGIENNNKYKKDYEWALMVN
jgi:hypothetical protein